MPIQPLLQELEPKDIARLVTAYERTLLALRLVDRTDPIADLVARKAIEIGLSGDRDAAEISNLAVMQLGSPQEEVRDSVADLTLPGTKTASAI